MKSVREQGFTYPLTLCLLILFLLFFSMHIEQLLTKRKMELETTVILEQEYYFLSSVKKLEELYQKEGSIPVKGTIIFVNGTMNYQAEPPSASIQMVNFTLFLNSRFPEPTLGFGYYNTGSKKLVKWVEAK